MYVIVFDIHNNKRRSKAVKLLLSYGIRVQYSVFEFDLEKNKFEKLKNGLKKILSDNDALRIYELPRSCPIDDIGIMPSLCVCSNECLVV